MDSFTKFDDKLPEKKISTAFFKMNIYPMSSTNMLKMCLKLNSFEGLAHAEN